MFKSKIKSLEELAEIIRKEKLAGHKVVLCHGCFDLVHLGHMKHFHTAKRHGDLLVVTITPDRFINKGPGRPVFNEASRLEALSNLEVIDFVGINEAPDAVTLLKRLQPDFYVKGDEYKDSEKDVTGKIIEEKEAVESYGGKLLFTSEQTFSSTSLIHSHFEYLSQKTSKFLKNVREQYSKEDVQTFIKKFAGLKVAVVGEAIVDEYIYCRAVGTMTKSPAISSLYLGTSKMAGGSMAIARHVAEFTPNVELFSYVGDNNDEASFVKEKLDEMKISSSLIHCPDRFTPVKRRFISGGYPSTLELQTIPTDDKLIKLFEIGFLSEGGLNEEKEEETCSVLRERLPEFDLVIVSDFGHGMVTPKVIDTVRQHAKWWSLNVQTNSTNYGFNLVTRHRGPSFLCLDEVEARLPFGDRHTNRDVIVEYLSRSVECDKIMLTMGTDGLMLRTNRTEYAPALALKTVDTVGAGDAVLSIASLCMHLGYPELITVFFSSVMGALASQIICNIEPVRKASFNKFVESVLKK